MVAASRRLVYSAGEIVQPVGSVPDAIAFIVDGELALTVTAEDGTQVTAGRVEAGDYIGTTALTRQRVLTGAVALRDTTLISVPRDTMAAIVQGNPQLARLLGETIELRAHSSLVGPIL